jgi:DnaJ-class molecular chaperone
MYLSSFQRRERLDNLNKRIKGMEDSYMTCKICSGTGLQVFYHDEIRTWDGMSYCDTCEGWGTIEWTEFVKKGLKMENFYIGKKKQNNARDI